MKLIKHHKFSETRTLQLIELALDSGHHGWWLVMTEATIPDKPLSQTIHYSETEAIDAFLKATGSVNEKQI